MRIRNGFISNSSTSSFIIVGFTTDKDYEELEQLEEEFKDLLIETEYGDRTVVGIKVARWSDDSSANVNLGLDEFNIIIDRAKKLGQKMGINEEPRIFADSVYC